MSKVCKIHFVSLMKESNLQTSQNGDLLYQGFFFFNDSICYTLKLELAAL